MTSIVNLPKAKYELEYNHGSIYSNEERDAILNVFDNNSPSCGPEVLLFEQEFATFNHVSYAVAVGNATQGLEIAVRSIIKATFNNINNNNNNNDNNNNVGSNRSNRSYNCLNNINNNLNGYEVIVPSVSWMSTASSAAMAGAIVKFADVISPTVCVNIDSIKSLVTDKTIAVIVVHLFGRPVDGLIELVSWLHDRNIYLIEDCAHAIGAAYQNGSLCGSIGDIGVFSFHQQKNMVTLGEGGMCITNNSNLHQYMIGYRSLCAMSYDPKGKYLAMNISKYPMGQRYWLMDFIDHGHNYRMIDIQASVGRVQLRKVLEFNLKRKEIANILYNNLHNMHNGLIIPSINDSITHSWHVFHVLVTDLFPIPKELFMWILLNEYNIKTWNHYVPMHLSTSFRCNRLYSGGGRGDCPVAEELFEQYVSLPIHPRLTYDAIQYMIDAIKELSTRPYVERLNPTPLLSELLALTGGADNDTDNNDNNIDDSKDDNIISDNNTTTCSSGISSIGEESIVDKQLQLLKPLVNIAINDGLFIYDDDDDANSNSNSRSSNADNSNRICIARAPGRLDLMGGNDDYTGGLVFECTISEATFAVAQRRRFQINQHDDNNDLGQESMIVIRNQQLSSDDISIPVSILLKDGLSTSELSSYLLNRYNNSRWQLYIIGVMYWLHKRYPTLMFSSSSSSSSSSTDDNSCYKKDGLSLLIWSQVPLNRGVSSSASVEVAVMKVIAHIFGITINGELLATACQWVENEICNSACGLMDQMAVTLGSPFMIMKCQPAIIYTNKTSSTTSTSTNNTSSITTNTVPSLPDDIIIYAIDSGVSHEISGIEYEAARVAAFMGYKMICDIEGLDVMIDNSSEIKRYTDIKYNGYLANLTPSQFSRHYEDKLPIKITGREYLNLHGYHVDPATNVREDHIYNVRANTKYAIYENNRVTLFYHLLNGCKKIREDSCQYEVIITT